MLLPSRSPLRLGLVRPLALSLGLGFTWFAGPAMAQPPTSEPPTDPTAGEGSDRTGDEPLSSTESADRDTGEATGDDDTAADAATRSKATSPARAADDNQPAADEKGVQIGDEDWARYVRLKLGPIGLAPIVLINVQATPYVGDEALVQAGDVAEQEGFRVRRARFGLAGDVANKAQFAFTMQLSSDEGGKIRIRDAWLGYTQFPFLRAFAGIQDVPYSRSALIRSGNQALIERPLAVRAMAPYNQVGVVLDGEIWDGALGYTAGIYNGFQRSSYFFEGYQEAVAPLGNRFDGLAYAFRISSDPVGKLDPTVADENHTWPPRFGVGGSYYFSDGGTRNIHGAGGDVLLHIHGAHLFSELLWSLSEPEEKPTQTSTQFEQVKAFAVVAEAGYTIVPRTLGLAARFEWLNPNNNVDDEADNWLITAGANYQLVDRLIKLQAEYTHREELYGQSLANDSVTLGFQLQLSALAMGDKSDSGVETPSPPPPPQEAE